LPERWSPLKWLAISTSSTASARSCSPNEKGEVSPPKPAGDDKGAKKDEKGGKGKGADKADIGREEARSEEARGEVSCRLLRRRGRPGDRPAAFFDRRDGTEKAPSGKASLHEYSPAEAQRAQEVEAKGLSRAWLDPPSLRELSMLSALSVV